jgi:hypothetical protein
LRRSRRRQFRETHIRRKRSSGICTRATALDHGQICGQDHSRVSRNVPRTVKEQKAKPKSPPRAEEEKVSHLLKSNPDTRKAFIATSKRPGKTPVNRKNSRWSSAKLSKRSNSLGYRLGNWLTAGEARKLWQLPDPSTSKGKRDQAILGMLLGCGLRRQELTELTVDHLQRREDHWVTVDLVSKGSNIRTIPVPDWVKETMMSGWRLLVSLAVACFGAFVGVA